MRKYPLFVLFSILVLFGLVLSACGEGGYEEEVYTEEGDYVTEESTGEDAGSAPLDPGTPGEVVFDFGFSPAENGFSFENYGDDIPATNPEGIYFGVDIDGDGEIDEEYVVDDAQ